MSVLDLEMRDVRRLVRIVADLTDDGGDGKPIRLRQLFATIGSDLAGDDSSPPAEDFVGFRNPPSPNVGDMTRTREKIGELQGRVRDAVIKRYGQAYADELWTRLQQ